jgi:hypothetical protein
MAVKSHLLQEDVAYYNPFLNGAALTSTTLQAAISAVGSARRTLFFPTGTWVISANLVFPSTLDVWIPSGAILDVNPGVTCTFDGGFTAPLVRVFSGTGILAFGNRLDAVHAQWWGALFDGTTDDAPALQAAINTAKPVCLPGATALIGTTLLLPSFATITGAGAKSVLKAKNNFGDISMLATAVDASTLGTRNTNIHLSAFLLDGNIVNNGTGGTNAHAIYLRTVQDVLIDHVAINGPKGSGIVMNPGTTPSVYSEGLVIRDMTIAGAGQTGIYISNGVIVRIISNYITTCGADGIVCLQDVLGSELREVDISHNQVVNCTGSGILAYATTSTMIVRTTIAHNIISVCGVYGIGYGNSHTLHIDHNSIQTVGASGIIDLIGGSGLTHFIQITHNTIGGAGGYGITYGCVQQAIILGNYVEQSQGAGIIVDTMAGGVVSSNTLKNLLSHGILLTSVTGTAITGNCVIGCLGHGLYATGLFGCVITGGVYNWNPGGGGIVESTGSNFNIITSNYARGNASTSIYVVGAQTIVDSNQI